MTIRSVVITFFLSFFYTNKKFSWFSGIVDHFIRNQLERSFFMMCVISSTTLLWKISSYSEANLKIFKYETKK